MTARKFFDRFAPVLGKGGGDDGEYRVTADRGAAVAAAPEFVGRGDSLAAVTGALGHADRDGPALVLVEGEAGIGKTRLVRECLAVPQLRGQRVMIAACPPLAEPFPLGPIVDGLRRLPQHVTGGVGLSPLCGALRPLFPEWADDLPPALEGLDDPAETRHRLFRALSELVERLGVEVLVVEDAHWADAATLEWLLTLMASGDPGMSMVVTYRPTDVPEGSPLLRLTSRAAAEVTRVRVELEPLDVADTRRLVGSMLGTEEVSEKFAEFLHERADGIPLAVEECVRLLRDRYDIVRHEGGWAHRLLEELEVPPTVRDSVLERVARLPAESRRVLEAAAVLAAPADQALLTRVAGLGEAGLADGGARAGVAGALASGLLQEAASAKPGRFVFRHVLDAQAVGEAIAVSERRWLHHEAGRALEGFDHPPVVRLARHFREAGEVEAWCHYAEASADLASESGDDHTAVTVLLELLVSAEHPTGRRVRLARKLGQTALYGTDPLGVLAAQVCEAIHAALTGDDIPPSDRGEVRLLGGLLWLRSGEFSKGHAACEAAIPDLAHRPDLAAKAMLCLAMPRTPAGTVGQHRRWLERATELLPDIESPLERLRFSMNRTTALLLLGDEQGWEAAAALPRLASSRMEERVVTLWQANLAWHATVWGRYADARAHLDSATELVAATGDRGRMVFALLARAYLDWYTGAWHTQGSVESVEGSESEVVLPISRLELRGIQGQLDLVRGDRRDRQLAEQRLREVADEFARLGVVEPCVALAPATLGRLHLADHGDGAVDAALDVTSPVVEMIARKGVWLWATDIAPVHLDALIGAGELAQAETLVDRFAAGLGDLDAPAPQAALVLCRAILAEAQGDHERAAGLFGEAAEAWAALPRPYDELLARERQGRTLLAVGIGVGSLTEMRDDGLAVLSEAQQRLAELGAKWDADRVAHLLRHHGVPVARAWRRGRRGYGEQLSPRERDVLALVARGMTNRQAAEVLFLSPTTVGGHLASAMRKLRVSSRTAAAMAATEAGLISTDDDPADDDPADDDTAVGGSVDDNPSAVNGSAAN